MSGEDGGSRTSGERGGGRMASSAKAALPARTGRPDRSRHGAITGELSSWRSYSSWARDVRRHWDEGK